MQNQTSLLILKKTKGSDKNNHNNFTRKLSPFENM